MVSNYIIIPAHNEEKTIAKVIKTCKKYGKVCVVDDGSIDNTKKIIQSVPGIHYVLLFPNRGKGTAIKITLRIIRGAELLQPEDNLIFIDGDGQHDPNYIPKFLEKLKTVEVVIGKRNLSKYPFYKKFGNFFLSGIVSLLVGMRIKDSECGFRAMKWNVMDDLLKFFQAERYGFESEIAVLAALREYKINFVEIPSTYRKGVGFFDGVRNFLIILKARFSE